MKLYDLEEGALRAVPCRLGEAAAPRVAAGLLLIAGWAASPVIAVVTARAESAVRHVQNPLRDSPLLRPAAAVRV